VAGLDELHHLGDPRGTDLRTALGLERFALARRDGSARPEAETAVAAALGMLVASRPTYFSKERLQTKAR
jgi:hypothetical protein